MVRTGGCLFKDGNLYKFNTGASVRIWLKRHLESKTEGRILSEEVAALVEIVDEEKIIEEFFGQMLDDWFLVALEE